MDGFNEEVTATEEFDFADTIPVRAAHQTATVRTRNIVRFTICFPGRIESFLSCNLRADRPFLFAEKSVGVGREIGSESLLL